MAQTPIKEKIYFVIDDDVDDQNFLIEALLENNPSSLCFTAGDGQEAVTSLEDATIPIPDVIFLDLNMPVLNGRECLALLKGTTSFQHIPVVIYSTTSNKKEIQETLEQGASYFLVKPHSIKALCEELSSIPVMKVRSTDIGKP